MRSAPTLISWRRVYGSSKVENHGKRTGRVPSHKHSSSEVSLSGLTSLTFAQVSRCGTRSRPACVVVTHRNQSFFRTWGGYRNGDITQGPGSKCSSLGRATPPLSGSRYSRTDSRSPIEFAEGGLSSGGRLHRFRIDLKYTVDSRLHTDLGS
jgi:hypothetical protein